MPEQLPYSGYATAQASPGIFPFTALPTAVRRTPQLSTTGSSTGQITSPHHPQFSFANLCKLVRGSSSRKVRYCDDLVRYGDVFLRFLSCRQAHCPNGSIIRHHYTHLAGMGRCGGRRGLSPSIVQVFLKWSKADQFDQGVAVFLGMTSNALYPVSTILAYVARQGDNPAPSLDSSRGLH